VLEDGHRGEIQHARGVGGGMEAARVIARKSLVIGKLLRRAHD